MPKRQQLLKNVFMYINSMEKNTSFKSQVGTIISLYSSGEIEKALENVDRLIKLNSNEAILYNLKGACFSDLGQLNEAIKFYENALSINPVSYTHLTLPTIYSV